jgi:hypothetical protein
VKWSRIKERALALLLLPFAIVVALIELLDSDGS